MTGGCDWPTGAHNANCYILYTNNRETLIYTTFMLKQNTHQTHSICTTAISSQLFSNSTQIFGHKNLNEMKFTLSFITFNFFLCERILLCV